MSKGIFITGTGTDIGKTYVTALMVKKLREAGYHAGYYKPALSGAKRIKGRLRPGDAHYVANISGIESDINDMVSYVYEAPVSPHLAGALEGNPARMEKISEDYKKLCKRYEYLCVEGSGGIICPIRYDNDEHIFLEDIIKKLNLSTLIVADSGLGTINATILTIQYMIHKNIPIKGVIFNNYHGGMMEEDNIKIVAEMTEIPIVGQVKVGDTELDMSIHQLVSFFHSKED